MPTVWTNLLAVLSLPAANRPPDQISLVMIAMTAFYSAACTSTISSDRAIEPRDASGTSDPRRRIRAGTSHRSASASRNRHRLDYSVRLAATSGLCCWRAPSFSTHSGTRATCSAHSSWGQSARCSISNLRSHLPAHVNLETIGAVALATPWSINLGREQETSTRLEISGRWRCSCRCWPPCPLCPANGSFVAAFLLLLAADTVVDPFAGDAPVPVAVHPRFGDWDRPAICLVMRLAYHTGPSACAGRDLRPWLYR